MSTLKTILVVTCLLWSTNAFGGERENALNHIAQVLALGKLCPELEPQQSLLVLMGVKFGVDFESDQTEILTQVRNQMAPWKGKEYGACSVGIFLYGPEGVNVPGLIEKR